MYQYHTQQSTNHTYTVVVVLGFPKAILTLFPEESQAILTVCRKAKCSILTVMQCFSTPMGPGCTKLFCILLILREMIIGDEIFVVMHAQLNMIVNSMCNGFTHSKLQSYYIPFSFGKKYF